jgi:hypothetical protein
VGEDSLSLVTALAYGQSFRLRAVESPSVLLYLKPSPARVEPSPVTPRLLQKDVSENFEFPRDITTSLELRFDSRIYFFLITWEYNTSKLTKLPQYINNIIWHSKIINTNKAFNIYATDSTVKKYQP